MSWYYNHDCGKREECGCRKNKRCGICECLFGLLNCFGCRKPFHDKCRCDKEFFDCKPKRDPWDKCIY